MDLYVITDEERIEDASYGNRFKAMNEFMLIQLPEFKENMSAEKHIDTLDAELYQLRRRYELNSPIIRIQAAYRAFKVRQKYSKRLTKVRWAIRKIQKVYRGFKLRNKMKKELYELMAIKKTPYLMMSNEEMKEYYAKRLLKKYIKRFATTHKTKKKKTVNAGVVQKYFRYFVAKEHSYIKAFQLEQYPWFY
jgi:myosin heavy subunit